MNNSQENSPHRKGAWQRMVRNVPIVTLEETAGNIVNLLLKRSRDFETIHYIYIADAEKKLLGVISVKELLAMPKGERVADKMQKHIISIHPHSHQERAAMLAIKYGIKSIPVITQSGIFLGVIPSDVILNILHEEHIEDILRSEGIMMPGRALRDLSTLSDGTYYRRRLPWLLLGLAGSVITAVIVGFFESTIKELLILSAFIPAIVYIADAVGSQTQTIFIRGLAVDPALNLKRHIRREVRVGLAIAVTLAGLMSIISYIWWTPAALGAILGFSFFITIIVAILIAMFLPWFFLRIKVDPAMASGPFATIIRDVTSVFLYFTIANFILGV